MHRFHFSIHESWGRIRKKKILSGHFLIEVEVQFNVDSNDDENLRSFSKEGFSQQISSSLSGCRGYVGTRVFVFFIFLLFSRWRRVFHFVKIYMYYYLTRFFSQIIIFIKYSAGSFLLLPVNEGNCETVFPRFHVGVVFSRRPLRHLCSVDEFTSFFSTLSVDVAVDWLDFMARWGHIVRV